MIQVSSSLPPLRKNEQSTGITVSEKMSEPTIANEIANAIGRNIFPSTPWSVKQRQEDEDDDGDGEDDRPAHFRRRAQDDVQPRLAVNCAG